jgi:hypothetical protein
LVLRTGVVARVVDDPKAFLAMLSSFIHGSCVVASGAAIHAAKVLRVSKHVTNTLFRRKRAS